MSKSLKVETEEVETIEVPVLIVGGGPAGLTMALELARRGIQGLLIERRNFTSHFPRAHLLNVRTMETFHDVGVAEEIYRQSPPEDEWHRVAWYTSLAGPTPLHGKRIGYLEAWGAGDGLADYELASPHKFANLPQIRLDKVLWEEARRARPDGIRSQNELVDLQIEESGCALATVHDRSRNTQYRVRARYVVAADGGRTVGDKLGVGVVGPRALLDHVSVYFSADLSAYADDEALLTYFVQPSGQGSFAGVLLGLGPHRWGRNCTEWLVGMSFHLTDPALQDNESLVAQAKSLIGIPDLQMDVHTVSHWQFEGVVAEKFRVGPVLLAGDAAHRHPPTGGLGLNTAIGDVSNLAWKIAAVLKGQASDSLLDTYEQERQQIAVQNVEHSLRNAGRHAPVAEAVGMKKGITEEEGWAELGIWASDTPEGGRRRRSAADAIAANRENFSQLGIEAGFGYARGALVAGAEDESVPFAAASYTPTTVPGHHLPHVWLQDSEGCTVSSFQLVAAEGLTLFVGADLAAAWSEACSHLDTPLTLRIIGVGGAYADPAGSWESVRGTEASGAVLVRPDRHVAWRTATLPSDAARVLASIIENILSPTIEPADGHLLDGVKRIAVAGEALRSGQRPAETQLFTERPAG